MNRRGLRPAEQIRGLASNPLCVPPESCERVRESGWRLGRGKGLAEVV